MNRIVFALLLALLALPALGADARPLPTQGGTSVHYPGWCRSYDRRAYQRALRACHGERACRHHVYQKGRACGLR